MSILAPSIIKTVPITNRLFEAGREVLPSSPREKERRWEWPWRTTALLLWGRPTARAVLEDWNQEGDVRGPGELVAEEQLSQSRRCGLPWQRGAESLLRSPAGPFSQPSASFAESDEPQRKGFPFERSSGITNQEQSGCKTARFPILRASALDQVIYRGRISGFPLNLDVNVEKKASLTDRGSGSPSALARIFELLTPPLPFWSSGRLFCTKISSPPGCVEDSQELPRSFSFPAAAPE